jgi:uncharacterized protein (DUF1697 family)
MMKSFVVLLRGINVGGKNKIPMADLKRCLEELGCQDLLTYIQSGNVLLRTNLDAKTLGSKIEAALSKSFKLDSSIIKVLVLSQDQLQAVIDMKPKGFGEQPAKYHSDVVFLMGIDTTQALQVFDPREGVDRIWPGDGVVYSQRLSELRTKSRLNKIVGTTAYQSMTIRNWNTTTKLLSLLRQQGEGISLVDQESY